MKRTYVATDLRTFINESKNEKNINKELNEGCNCGKTRPNKPVSANTKLTTQNSREVAMSKTGVPTIKKGIVSKTKLNESVNTIKQRITRMANDIKSHKFSNILESTCKDSTKLKLMINEGASEGTAKIILEQFNKKVSYIQKGFERIAKLNEGFDMIEDEIDNCDDYDFKDRRHGHLTTGLYDSAPDCIDMEEDIESPTISEDGFDEDFSDELDTDEDFSDELDAEDELDQVGEEVEIKKFVFGVDDVQGAIGELRELGIDAQEFSEDGEDESFGVDGESNLDMEEIDVDEDGVESDALEGLDEGAKSKKPKQIYEGEIIIDVENWEDDEYDAFTSWLESYDINPNEIFGEDTEIEVSDVEDDFTDEDFADEESSEEDEEYDDYE